MKQRQELYAALNTAIEQSKSSGGGVVVLLGRPGVGKSVLAKMWAEYNKDAIYFDGAKSIDAYQRASDENGIFILDEFWQFPDVDSFICSQIQIKRKVVVVVAAHASEVERLGENLQVSHVNVPHWNSLPKIPTQASSFSGVIRYRGPEGQTWTGVGRRPNWIVQLEQEGRSRSEFQVSDTPIIRRKKGDYLHK